MFTYIKHLFSEEPSRFITPFCIVQKALKTSFTVILHLHKSVNRLTVDFVKTIAAS